ncbi:MAG: RNA polymerase sigma factor [Planctomycetota bacterium]
MSFREGRSAANQEVSNPDQAWYAAMRDCGLEPDVEPLTEKEAWAEFLASPAVGTPTPRDEDPLLEEHTALLVREAQDGNRHALSLLMERYHPRVLDMVRRRLGQSLRQRLDSGDVAQDVLAESIRSLVRFRQSKEDSFRPWLRALVENRIRNLSRGQVPSSDVDTTELELRASSEEEGTAAWREKREWEEKRQRLDRVIETLGGLQGEVVRLRYRDGLSYREIGAKLGRSEAAVSMLLSRARASIARKMAGPERRNRSVQE